MVDELGAAIGVEAANHERETVEQQRDHRQQVGFADVFHRGHQFPLGDDIDGIDMVDPLHPILIALVHGIDADIAGQALRGRCFAHPDGHR